MSHRNPPRLTLALWLIRIAGWAVPRDRRSEWLRQWEAELTHRWRIRNESRGNAAKGGLLVWSLGAFGHAWYMFRTEFTMDSIWQDLRFAVRSLRNGPGLIAVAVLSLGLGIGANATIFSAVDVFMLQPLPYPDPDRLLVLSMTNEERGWTNLEFSLPDFLDYREISETMNIAVHNGASFNVSAGDRPERIVGREISWNFLDVVGVQPALGRGFTPAEESVGQDKVAILGDPLWHRQFGADPGVLGSSILLDGVPHTVVGIMPPGFWFEQPGNEIWTPLSFTGDESRRSHFLEAVGRIREGHTLEQARAEASQIAASLSQQHPETNAGNGSRVITVHEDVFDEGFRMGSLIASVAVAFVLLIACANVANLLLARAAGRAREVALRGALGAGRVRIVRLFLTESLLVAVMGGVLGVALSIVGIDAFVSLMPSYFARIDEITLNGRVLAYTATISFLTAVIFGLAPALQVSRPNLTESLKEGGRGETGSTGGRLRKMLVVAEISMALVLLVSSALLVQGFLKLRTTELGFQRDGVLTFRITLPEGEYDSETSRINFFETLHQRLGTVPDVSVAGATHLMPLVGNSATRYTVAGEEPSEAGREPVVSIRILLAGYFEALQIPTIRGRTLEMRDRSDAPFVVVINEDMAARHWPDTDPIGHRIRVAGEPREIVGVVANTRDWGAESAVGPMVYVPMHQYVLRSMAFVLASDAAPSVLADAVRGEVAALDPNLPVYQLMTVAELLLTETGDDAVMAKIMAALAVIALVLAIGGVYGVMAYSVSQRTQELGIRVALGAQRTDVVRLVVRQGTVLALVGIVVGVVLALGVTKSLSLFLFGVSPFDPITFSAVGALLLGSGLVATYLPARRATKVDPIIALRTE